MAYVEQGSRSRIPSVAAVVLVHGAIGYAFISGLAYNVIKEVVPVFTVTSIEDTPPPKVEVPPPPQKQEVQQPMTRPEVIVELPRMPDVAPIPSTIFEREADPVPVAKVETPPSPPPSPALAKAARPSGNKGSWISTDDYPAASLRAEEAGTVGISVAIDARGRVSDCRVTQSSGYPRLDEVTCRIYARRARFAPAVDANGAEVASTFVDRVRWQIPN